MRDHQPALSLRNGRRFAAGLLTAAVLSVSPPFVLAQASPAQDSPAQADSLLKEEQAAFKAAAAAISPSILQLQTFGGLDRVGDVRTGIGPTSAVAISPDGYLMSSAYNLASGPSAVLARLPDGRQLDAKIIATDHVKMLTLLKIEANDLVPPVSANPEELQVGQWTLAIGKAFDPKTPNLSPGVLSAKDRMWGKALQTDAKISPFNYGGLLVDLRGRALGIIVPMSMSGGDTMAGADWYDSGIGFAIPMPQVQESFERLKAGEDLHRGSLGIALKEGANILAVPEISEVVKGSPAESAGFQKGDVVISADGRYVAYTADLQRALGPHYSGDTLPFKVRRGDETVELTATLAKPQAGEGELKQPEAEPETPPSGQPENPTPEESTPAEESAPEK